MNLAFVLLGRALRAFTDGAGRQGLVRGASFVSGIRPWLSARLAPAG